MSTPNIALTGRLRSGKDTVAAYFTEKYGYTQFAFGDGIREVCRRLYPEQLANGAKPRAILQQVGEFARTIDRDVWINDMFRRISDREQVVKSGAEYFREITQPVRVVCSDMRQPHEFSALKERGYVIIRVNASDGVRINRAVESGDTFSLRDLTHGTESHVDTFSVDYDVYNVGTLDELYAQIDAIMAAITEVGV